MTKLILVRHGETEWNKDWRYQGQADLPLNKEGRRQALKLAKRLKEEKISAILSSDLKRAYQTANIIAKSHHLRVKKRTALREINYGVFEGLLLEEVKKRYKTILERWWDDPLSTRIPEGETLKEFKRRVSAVYEEIVGVRPRKSKKEVSGCQSVKVSKIDPLITGALVGSDPKKTILIVAHGGSLRIIVACALGLKLPQIRRIRFDNAGISIIILDKARAVLTLMNDLSHLQQLFPPLL